MNTDLRECEIASLGLSIADLLQILELLPDALFVMDLGGRIRAANQMCERLFGRTRHELIGHDVAQVIPNGLQPGDVSFWNRRGDPQASGHDSSLALEARRGDGTRFQVDARLTPVGTQAGPCLAVCVRDATQRLVAELGLRWRASHDLLTGLPNRELLFDRLGMALARARRRPRSLGVLFIDLDRFKHVNDCLGHAAGDEVLRVTGRTLRASVRAGDTASRVGGDEFVVLCEDVHGLPELVEVARRVQRGLQTALATVGHDLRLGASIGVALAQEGDVEPEVLLQRADAAMYLAKKRHSQDCQVALET